MQSGKYFESLYVLDGLNHDECVGEENLGWTRGILSNGIPFEAELWIMDHELTISVIIPEFMRSFHVWSKNEEEVNLEDNIVISSRERIENGVLKIGLYDRGTVLDDQTIINYVEFLEEYGIITFLGQEYNGGVHRYKDKYGNSIVEVIVTLNSYGKALAETSLVFRSFVNSPQRTIMYKKMYI